jgi:polyphosphate kinase 2 (PPK2 family)
MADIKTRKHWDEYQAAYQDVLNKCSTKKCPWHVVPADHKWYRDHVVSKTVVKALEELKMRWPKAKEDLSDIKIK